MSKINRFISILLATILAIGILAGCTPGNPTEGGNSNDVSNASSTAEELKPIEYTFLDTVHATAPFGYNNPNDVVSPWVEENLKVKVKEVIFAAGQTPMERVNMMVAAENLPDVVLIDSPDIASAYATGAFADLTDYISSMPNIDKYVSDVGWNMNSVDGRVVAIPVSRMEMDTENPEVAEILENDLRSEENTSELQSPNTVWYDVFCLKKKQKKTKKNKKKTTTTSSEKSPEHKP